jgi:hypothetical protein
MNNLNFHSGLLQTHSWPATRLTAQNGLHRKTNKRMNRYYQLYIPRYLFQIIHVAHMPGRFEKCCHLSELFEKVSPGLMREQIATWLFPLLVFGHMANSFLKSVVSAVR